MHVPPVRLLRRHDWLSSHIRPQRVRSRTNRALEVFSSKLGFAVVIGTSTLIFVIIATVAEQVPHSVPASADFQLWLHTLWQVQASTLGIVFAVVALLLQTVRGGLEDDRLFRALIIRSALIPVACFSLWIVFLNGVVLYLAQAFPAVSQHLPGIASASAVMFGSFILAVGGMFLLTLWLLRPGVLRALRRELFDEAIAVVTDRDISYWRGKQILERVCKSAGLDYSPGGIGSPNHKHIRTGARGRVIDVDLQAVHNLLAASSSASPRNRGTESTRTRGAITTALGFEVASDRDVLAEVSPELFDEARAAALIAGFRIGAYPDGGGYLIQRLGLLKDQAFEDIRAERPVALGETLRVYENAVEQALSVLQHHGIIFSAQATADSFPWLHIQTDIFAIARRVLQHDDVDMVEMPLLTIFQLMRSGLEHESWAVFNGIVQDFPRLYLFSGAIPDPEVRRYVIGLLSEALSSVVNDEIWPAVKNGRLTDARRDFALRGIRRVILAYGELLRASIQNGASVGFIAYAQGLDCLFTSLADDS
jgi:hypothetical protein